MIKREESEKFKSLDSRQKLQYIYDYYKWYILAAIGAVVIICTFANMLWTGLRTYRLRVLAVTNTEADCSGWFDDFGDELTADGKGGAFRVNLDQPFDPENSYFYLQQAEVMAYVTNKKVDVAICTEDLYRFLLAQNVCLALDTALPDDMSESLLADGRLLYDTANLQEDDSGNVDPADGIDGYYGIDLSGTDFYEKYNTPADGEPQPLYAVMLYNTEHIDDGITLLRALLDDEK
jgi:hypothetical protein